MPGSGPTLRLATPADAPAIAAIYAPYVTDTAISFELVPPDAAEMAARMEKIIVRTPYVVAELDGAVRGYAYGSRHRDRAAYDWTVETTVYVDRTIHRQGLGRRTMTAVLEILRLQGAHLAVAGITPPNPGSIGLHAALGFEHIGSFEAIGYKFGTWHGVEWMAMELGPRSSAPPPVVPLPELLATAEGAAAVEAILERAAR